MKRLIVILLCFICIGQTYGQIDSTYNVTNELHYVYPTLQRVIDLLPYMELHKKIQVDENIDKKGGWFIVHDSTESIDFRPNGVTVIATPNSSRVAIRDYQSTSIKVEWFGLIGDGTTDNYAAFQKMSTFVSGRKGLTISYKQGKDYLINQYKIQGGSNQNTIKDITYTKATKIKIEGNGANIIIKGNFNRAKDNGASSYENSVVPFQLIDCHNFIIDNLTMDGNVDEMTKDAGTTEGICYGIQVLGSSHVTLTNDSIHHFATDGIYIGSSGRTISKYLAIQNISSMYNARQGISIIQLKHAVIQGSNFDSTGRSSGSYGSHLPGDGVDIEPNSVYPTVEENTQDIHFINCQSQGNMGSALVCALGDRAKNILWEGGLLDAIGGTEPRAVWMAAANFVIRDAYIRLDSNNYIYPAYGNSFNFNQDNVLDHNTIESRGVGISVQATADLRCVIKNNLLVGAQYKTFTGFFPDINGPAIVTDNIIKRDSSTFNPSGAPNINQGRYRFCPMVARNKYLSNLDTSKTHGKSFEIYSQNSYVENEFFPSVGASIKPLNPEMLKTGYSSTWGDLYNAVNYKPVRIQPFTITPFPVNGDLKYDTAAGGAEHWYGRTHNVWKQLDNDTIASSIHNQVSGTRSLQIADFYVGSSNPFILTNSFTVPVIPQNIPNSGLNVANRLAAGWLSPLHIFTSGDSSGMSFSSPFNNSGIWNVGGYYYSTISGVQGGTVPLSSTMSAIAQRDGVFSFMSGSGYTPGLTGQIGLIAFTNGSGYTNGVYTNVPTLTGGTGTGATLDITVTGGLVTASTINNIGNGYNVGDTLGVSTIGSGTGFLVTIFSTTGVLASPVTLPIIARLDANGFNMGANPSGNNARLTLKANTTLLPTAHFDLAGAVPEASSLIGDFQVLPYYILFRDSTGTVDTLSTRTWGRANFLNSYHPAAIGAAPTVVGGTNVTPTLDANAKDASFQITLVVATGGTTGTVATITFNTAWGVIPKSTFSAANALAAGAITQVWANATNTTTLVISTSGTLAAGTYLFTFRNNQ